MTIRPQAVSLFVLFSLLAGCSGSSTTGTPGVNTGGSNPPTTPLISLSPAALSFPTTAAGTSAPLPLAVSNTGGTTLVVTAIAINGANANVFSQSTNCGSLPFSLAAGSSCTVTATFLPALASTNYTANITFTDNTGGAAGSTQTVTLTGSGAAPAPVAQAVLSPTSLSFSAALGVAAGAKPVTLSNPGTATLTGIAISLSGNSSFSQSSTCGTSLAAGSSCSIAVNFTPSGAGNVTGLLSVADSATGSPQTVSLAGAGALPLVTLSASSITFPTTVLGGTSAASNVVVSNTGSANLTISSIVLGGTNASNFAETNMCGLTLAPGASCTISATFSPVAATTYNATISIADSATGSPQVISLQGGGATSAVSRTMLVFPEPDNSVTPLYALVNGAKSSIDMTMYALQDTTFSADLVAACQRGVKVRVILDQNNEKSSDTPAYNQLNAAANCSAVWANTAFQVTHQKSILIDGTQVAIMSLNLQSQYYSTTRDFALVENDATDIAAIQATFNADYLAGTPASGVAGVSDFSYVPGGGDQNDLIWSPTTAQASLLALINGATKTLLVENEEMSASNIVSALASACSRGVAVHIAMVADSSYTANFTTLKAAGCGVNLYPNTATGFYVHAKAMVADYGLATQSVYMGSINFSNASMNSNRELGIYISDPVSVQTLNSTIAADYAGGTPF